jgi:hypothetical protein
LGICMNNASAGLCSPGSWLSIGASLKKIGPELGE